NTADRTERIAQKGNSVPARCTEIVRFHDRRSARTTQRGKYNVERTPAKLAQRGTHEIPALLSAEYCRHEPILAQPSPPDLAGGATRMTVPIVFDRRTYAARRGRAARSAGDQFLVHQIAESMAARLGAVEESFSQGLGLGSRSASFAR